MNKRMFDDFKPVSAKQWKQKIQVDLKGADYNDALIWKSIEGINVKPFYTAEHLPKNKYYVNTSSNWKIAQTIYVFNVEKSNTNALKQLENGIDVLHFIIPNKTVNLDTLLHNIPSNVTLYFTLEFLSFEYIKWIFL